MKEIAQVAGKVLQLVVRLLWLITKLLFRWLSQSLTYLYRHRVQIIGYKYTPALVLLVCTLWFMVSLRSQPTTSVSEEESGQPSVSYPNRTNDPVLVKHDLTRYLSKPKTNKRLLLTIESWLGTPHCDGGNTQSGTDCSGFVQAVVKETYGIRLKRSAADIYAYNTTPINSKNLQEGDLLFFRINGQNISHVGIYLRNNTFAHASTSKGVTISSLNEPYYAKTFYRAGRIKTWTL